MTPPTPIKLRFTLMLMVSALWLGTAGCATQPAPQTTPISTNRTTTDADYPTWTKAAGWLLLPFTGASQSLGF